ncbi:hypothetical protein [Microvirga thermotolerans]|uniref:Uncharacterized protein n=1 Tax=Microvirga thermotolerans TaxID=2651334 RepID=A0A5P9JT79_9HYPH|nr:hypothetical protein [Microvirga thermotolerans]QFU15321.1 hypothetical protein GDR74_03265 [Microvirga thermotolerans]
MTREFHDEASAERAALAQFNADLQALNDASVLMDLKTVAAISQRVLMDGWDDRCTPLAQALARITADMG